MNTQTKTAAPIGQTVTLEQLTLVSGGHNPPGFLVATGATLTHNPPGFLTGNAAIPPDPYVVAGR